MMNRVEWTAFMIDNYGEGVDIIGYGEFYPCKMCAAVVYHTGDALQRHAKWHLEQRLTVSATNEYQR